MGKSITLEKEIKIRNVKKTFKSITDMKTPLEIDMKQVESVDGAGFQLIAFLYSQKNKFPKKYKINGLPDKIGQLIISFGLNLDKSEVTK